MKVLILEERALYVKQGDKAWSLKTKLVIHYDNGAIIDVSLVAINILIFWSIFLWNMDMIIIHGLGITDKFDIDFAKTMLDFE